MTWIDEALAFWKAENIELSPPASLEQIRQVETIVGYTFPQDFVDLYLCVDGFLKWEWNKAMFSLFNLERALEEHNFLKNKDFIPFCDYLINSHQIGFKKDKQGIFKDYGGNYGDELICQTFEEAILLINTDSYLIY
jgi:hypothetical protein